MRISALGHEHRGESRGKLLYKKQVKPQRSHYNHTAIATEVHISYVSGDYQPFVIQRVSGTRDGDAGHFRVCLDRTQGKSAPYPNPVPTDISGYECNQRVLHFFSKFPTLYIRHNIR